MLLLLSFFWNRRLVKADKKLIRFHHCMNETHDGIFIIKSEDGRILEANLSACKSLGYTLEEMLELHVWNFSERIADRKTWDYFSPIMMATEGEAFESAHRRKDGAVFPVEISVKYHEEKSGNFFIAIARDITERKQAEQELQESNNKYRALTETTKDFVWEVDANGFYTYCSPQVASIFGYQADELIGITPFDLMPASEAERVGAIFKEAVDNLRSLDNIENTCLSKDGDSVVVETSGQPFFDDQGALLGYRGIDRDITIRVKTEVALRASESRFRELFDNMSDGVAIYEAVDEGEDFIFIDYNQAGERIGKNKKEEVIGSRLSEVFPGAVDMGLFAVLQRVLKTGEPELFPVASYNDNRIALWVENYVFRIRDKEVVAIYQDITAQKEYQQQLEHIAHFDALTNLPNRVLLSDRLNQAMHQEERRGKKLAVAYLDLDGFKTVNDDYGHEVGDQLLAVLAMRMKDVLREGDTVARMGGDEFVAVLIDLSEQNDSVQLLERLLDSVSHPVQLGDHKLQVEASIGVAFYPQIEIVDADQLIRQADQAMYMAKQAGKNRYQIFDSEQARSIRGHHEILGRISLAIRNREFYLYYQPIVNMCTGDVLAVEALIRWNHPTRGLVAPAEFLPYIINSPISSELDEWVIESALSQLQSWQSQNLKLQVNLNLGAMYLQQGDFVDRLNSILRRFPAIVHPCLEIEVLESAALKDIDHLSKVMEECKKQEIRFSLDDFGTGYSSLTYLRRLPADTIKIDRSFVRDMLVDPEDFAILDGVLGLASSFDRAVIAEGVESVKHGELLLL
ncbi:MAG: EAL domain-containing protein, partial [Candidatus Thiodiazotropha lotti]